MGTADGVVAEVLDAQEAPVGGEADLPPSLLDGVRLLLVSGYSFFSAGPRAAVAEKLRLEFDLQGTFGKAGFDQAAQTFKT